MTKSNRRFSSLPIDQAHEQANKRVKGAGGIIGLTENPAMLQRWIAAGPEISRALEEFSEPRDDDEILPHHEEGPRNQSRFQRHVRDMLDTLLTSGNPFEEFGDKLVSLDNKECQTDAAAQSVLKIQSIGQEQYNKFKKEKACYDIF